MQGTLSFSNGAIGTFRSRRPVTSAAMVEAPPRRAESLYEVLQVKQDASLREIKTAYRSLAKQYHPDVSAAKAAAEAAMAGKEFIEIHEAYAKLSDPEARAEYDAARRRRYQTPQQGFRPENQYYSGQRWETDQCW